MAAAGLKAATCIRSRDQGVGQRPFILTVTTEAHPRAQYNTSGTTPAEVERPKPRAQKGQDSTQVETGLPKGRLFLPGFLFMQTWPLPWNST